MPLKKTDTGIIYTYISLSLGVINLFYLKYSNLFSAFVQLNNTFFTLRIFADKSNNRIYVICNFNKFLFHHIVYFYGIIFHYNSEQKSHPLNSQQFRGEFYVVLVYYSYHKAPYCICRCKQIFVVSFFFNIAFRS